MKAMDWTVVTRKPRGRFFHPVANVPAGLNWHGAVDVARELGMAHPDLDVWYVPTRDAQAEGWPEDRDNILLPSGKRLPIRWDSEPQASYQGGRP